MRILVDIMKLFFSGETLEEQVNRQIKERQVAENARKLVLGAKVEFIDSFYDGYHGIVVNKRLFNSWECDVKVTFYEVDIYAGEKKIGSKECTHDQIRVIQGEDNGIGNS